MVHYAYIKWRNSRDTSRAMLIAPSPEVIDEWWRAVSSKRDGNYERIAPDFYSFVSGAIVDAAPEIDSRIMWTNLPDLNARNFVGQHLPPRTDNVSGGTYFIRAKSNPEIYWYAAPEGGKIYATRAGRTRFHIRIDNDEDETRWVMIGKDRITMTSCANPKLSISVEGGELVLAARGAASFAFGDLRSRFLADGLIDKATVQQVEKGHGEEWELVK